MFTSYKNWPHMPHMNKAWDFSPDASCPSPRHCPTIINPHDIIHLVPPPTIPPPVHISPHTDVTYLVPPPIIPPPVHISPHTDVTYLVPPPIIPPPVHISPHTDVTYLVPPPIIPPPVHLSPHTDVTYLVPPPIIPPPVYIYITPHRCHLPCPSPDNTSTSTYITPHRCHLPCPSTDNTSTSTYITPHRCHLPCPSPDNTSASTYITPHRCHLPCPSPDNTSASTYITPHRYHLPCPSPDNTSASTYITPHRCHPPCPSPDSTSTSTYITPHRCHLPCPSPDNTSASTYITPHRCHLPCPSPDNTSTSTYISPHTDVIYLVPPPIIPPPVHIYITPHRCHLPCPSPDNTSASTYITPHRCHLPCPSPDNTSASTYIAPHRCHLLCPSPDNTSTSTYITQHIYHLPCPSPDNTSYTTYITPHRCRLPCPSPNNTSTSTFISPHRCRLPCHSPDNTSTSTYILANGRSCGDLTGKYTCCQWNGQSVVDVFMAQSDVLSRINYFKIGKFDWYSDHAPISVDLSVDIAKYIEPPVEWKKVVKQLQRWDNDAKAKMKDTLIKEPFVSLLDNFCNTSFASSADAANSLTSILQQAIKKVFPRRSKHRRAHCNSKIPFSHEIQIAKRIYRKSKRLYDKNKTSITRRQNHIIEKKKYRKAIYKAKKIAQEMKLNRLAELEHSDPKRFWADVTRIIRPRDDSVSCIEPWKWYKHFQSLLRPPAECDANSQFSKYVSGALPTLEGVSVPNNDLNKNFNADEIKDTIKDLKIGKATFLDELSNELFKFTFDTLCRPLLHLFNMILSMGDFLSPWSEGLIVPIHKKNDRLCVDNYRGIIISSCIGKVFIKILTKRIDNFMIDSGKWKINQCGFKPEHRTEDNLFILKSIHESYAVETNTNIHAAFIDFNKFFDTIDRMYLFYKLLKNNITGKVYNIIKSMYANPQYSVMVNGMISPKFTSSFGVKQGCCMSPVLSNIFQNDIHDIFSQDECDPVRLYDIYINSISWADDLLILSHSRKGLQTCLDKLHAYCSKWGLVVNQTKTKTMVFSKNKWQPEKFYYGNSEIECVKEIQHLGFNITHNMNMKNLITDRHKKAEKMSNLFLRALRTSKNVSAKLSLSLFDKYLSPILLYGCSIWGIPKSFKLIYLIEQPENNDTRKTVTRALTASCGYNIGFSSAKRVGKRCATKSGPILINLNCIQDAENILRQSGPYQFLPYEDRALPNIDAFHLNFCKKSLNISKYASNSAVLGELGRYPLTITCWSQVVKYCLRLVNGTNNVLLNSAFQMASHENHTWAKQYISC